MVVAHDSMQFVHRYAASHTHNSPSWQQQFGGPQLTYISQTETVVVVEVIVVVRGTVVVVIGVQGVSAPIPPRTGHIYMVSVLTIGST